MLYNEYRVKIVRPSSILPSGTGRRFLLIPLNDGPNYPLEDGLDGFGRCFGLSCKNTTNPERGDEKRLHLVQVGLFGGSEILGAIPGYGWGNISLF